MKNSLYKTIKAISAQIVVLKRHLNYRIKTEDGEYIKAYILNNKYNELINKLDILKGVTHDEHTN